VADARIVAVGLLTQEDVDLLGATFERLWPVNETPCFGALLHAIDEADRQLWRERDDDEREIQRAEQAALLSDRRTGRGRLRVGV
jgi:hypothetical protein